MRHIDIIRMIRGSSPRYNNEALKYLEAIGLGKYVGGHVDSWRWEPEDSKCWDLQGFELAYIYRRYCEH